MGFALTPKNIADIREHAVYEYPKEACGLIVDGEYARCFNYATDPLHDFIIPAEAQMAFRAKGQTIQAVVHSHPDGPKFPTATDMTGQISSGLPWVLVGSSAENISEIEIWGDDSNTAPLIGRQFLHGIRDCYSLVRDVFRLGKDALSEQGIDWPLEPILLPDFARDDGWWGEENRPKQNLYTDNFAKVGFKEIPREKARPGDAFLMKIRSDNLNHAGVLLNGGLILHHLPQRLSRREPSGLWGKSAHIWVRYGDSN